VGWYDGQRRFAYRGVRKGEGGSFVQGRSVFGKKKILTELRGRPGESQLGLRGGSGKKKKVNFVTDGGLNQTRRIFGSKKKGFLR